MEVDIYLAQIEGYLECYTEPIVKEIGVATEVSINEVLRFYIDNKTFDKKDSLGLLVNERLIWMATYLYYKNDETIKRLEKTSKVIIVERLAANN